MSEASSFIIRPARPDEFEALCPLWEVLDEEHRVVRPDWFHRPAGERRRREDIAALIAGPDGALLVAEADGRLLGLSSLFIRTWPATTVRAERRVVEIDNIVVDPAARRRGVARALIEASAAWARGRGFDAIELSVFEFNREALAFYQAMGFATMLRRVVRTDDRG
jgi:diamine N-acetyltransferase